MLTDNEREKIRLEEEYRLEVRNQLQEANQKTQEASQKESSKLRLFLSGAWSFLNSSFGLWVLSAICITGASVAYTNYQNSRAERLKNEEAIQKLDLELSYRYSQVLIQLYNLLDWDNGKLVLKRHGPDDVRKVLDLLEQQPKADPPSIYPEFSKMGIPALIVELKRHIQREEEHRELDIVLGAVTGGIFEDADLSNLQQVAGRILEKLVLPRWKKSHFYFINCPASDPFKAEGICYVLSTGDITTQFNPTPR